MVLSLAFLVLTFRVFMMEANTSLGLSRVSGMGLQGLVVNVQSYVPPVDSILRPSQLTMLLHVIEELDSLAETKGDESSRRQAFAQTLNQYTTSLSEYRWIRNTAKEYVGTSRESHRSGSRADSVNAQRMRMFSPRIRIHPRFFRDTLDREALNL
ncbi:MAG: hypothetical protein NTX15_06390 [Candidatus Kapabacteria bacterium]|nr:hypothetical protein [Candidatus Kapabacteria bacterium]